MILQILGVIFLLVVGIVAYFGWKIYRLAKAASNSDIAKAMSVLPQIDMELIPASAKDWKETEQLEYAESELKKTGARHIGYFCVYNGHATIRISMWNCKDLAVAVIYEAFSDLDEDAVTFIYEVSCQLRGGTLCLTSNPHAIYEQRPGNHLIVHKDANSIRDLIKALKTELPKSSTVIKIKDAKDYFQTCYEDIAEWGWREDQLRSDKTQQLLSSIGIDVTEELMEQLVEMGESYTVDVYVDRARRRLAEKGNMSADEWESVRDKLVFINERMNVDHLISAVYELEGELSDIQEQALEGFEINTKELSDPVSGFQMLLQSLNLKAKRIAKMDKPIKTEVYLPL
ncbi:MAG: hypothetical protein AAF387_18025 [Pseudomonadota bacterium]